MDHQADLVIAKWSGGALAANLLPPPFDLLAVSATFVRMGQQLARVYEVRISARELRPLAKAMVKGVTGVELAAHLGTDVFKYVPGVNVAVALLIQPPIVAAIAYSVGTAYKRYYRVLHTEGRALTPGTAAACHRGAPEAHRMTCDNAPPAVTDGLRSSDGGRQGSRARAV